MSANRKNRSNRSLQVESLETLTLLSGMSDLVQLHSAAMVSTAAKAVVIHGPTTGTFQTSQSNPDTGKDYHVATQGKTNLGQTFVTGDLFTPGFIRQGRTTGTLKLVTASGTLTLAVKGPLQDGFSPLPSNLGYTITGGTGAYANHHKGSGTIDVAYKVTGTTSGQTLNSIGQTGTISLTFESGSPNV